MALMKNNGRTMKDYLTKMECMRKLAIWIVAVALISTSSCVNHKDEAALPVIKVGLVGGIGGFSDRGLTRTSWQVFSKQQRIFH
jgi:hypothetical protein